MCAKANAKEESKNFSKKSAIIYYYYCYYKVISFFKNLPYLWEFLVFLIYVNQSEERSRNLAGKFGFLIIQLLLKQSNNWRRKNVVFNILNFIGGLDGKEGEGERAEISDAGGVI